MVTDRFTAQILGGVTVVMTILIDLSMVMFTSRETTHKSSFPLFLFVLSLPMIGAAVYFFRRASQLKNEP